MTAKAHPDAWKNSIRSKLNEQGWAFNVERDWDGSVKNIKEYDPLAEYEYDPVSGEWHPKEDGQEKDNNFSIEGVAIARGLNIGSKVTDEETEKWIGEWISARDEESDREAGKK